MKSIPEISVEAKILLGLFQKMETGQTLSYTELSAAVGRDVQNDGYGAAMTARRRAERDFGIVLAPVIGVGLKRIDDTAIVAAGDRYITKAKRDGRRAVAITTRIRDFAALSPEARADVARIQSTAGIIELFASSKGQRRIASEVTAQGAVVPPQRMLDAFKKAP